MAKDKHQKSLGLDSIAVVMIIEGHKLWNFAVDNGINIFCNPSRDAGSEPEGCPVSWLSHVELQKRNYYTINKQPKIIHVNHHIKPEDKYFPKPVSINKIDRSDVILKPLSSPLRLK
ncbi:unnamed protein product [Schistosoma bovis]|nr:unnamed protein product [Schistosoma bovis]